MTALRGMLAAIRRQRPAGQQYRIERAFLHGYHAGLHDAVDGRNPLPGLCEALQLDAEVFGV